MKKPKPTKADVRAATRIATAYARLLDALGHPDELGQLPKVIEKIAEIIRASRRGQ